MAQPYPPALPGPPAVSGLAAGRHASGDDGREQRRVDDVDGAALHRGQLQCGADDHRHHVHGADQPRAHHERGPLQVLVQDQVPCVWREGVRRARSRRKEGECRVVEEGKKQARKRKGQRQHKNKILKKKEISPRFFHPSILVFSHFH